MPIQRVVASSISLELSFIGTAYATAICVVAADRKVIQSDLSRNDLCHTRILQDTEPPVKHFLS
jgi:hypothetical protein